MAFAVKGYAQETCNGSLGDPIIHQDFGSGTAKIGPELPQGSTQNLTYENYPCPDDGQYSIIHSLTGSDNCHQDTWHNVYADHTGNTNGYMMIINASKDKDKSDEVFFSQPAPGLCPGTKYQFSVYVLNLLKKSVSGPDWQEPNIQFTIKDKNGNVQSKTQIFNPTDGPDWQFFEMYFSTTGSTTDLVVEMTNLAPGGNGNDLIIDDINFRACGPMLQIGFGAFDGTTMPQGVCEGTGGQFTLKAQANGITPPYQWQSSFNDGNWTDIIGENTNTLNLTLLSSSAVGAYKYRFGVSNGSDITAASCRVYSPPLEIDVTPLPVATATEPPPLCDGDPLTLTATGAAKYIWSGPNTPPTAPTADPFVINSVSLTDAGPYTVIPISDKGCYGAPKQVQVSVLPKIQAAVNTVEPICAGKGVQLIASGGLHYKWTPSTGLDHDDIFNPIATPLETTTYSVSISNEACTDNSKSVTVTVWQNPVAHGGGNKVIFEGQSVKLNGSVDGDDISFQWSPATGLDNPNSATPIATPTDDITYTLTVTSLHCNVASDPVFVRVYKKITIPNTFSPNNDGINDNWNIDALITYPESSIMVFNRYGKKVYQSTGYAKAWDGTYNGSALPEGTYYYVIDLKNNTPKLTGWVLIVK